MVFGVNPLLLGGLHISVRYFCIIDTKYKPIGIFSLFTELLHYKMLKRIYILLYKVVRQSSISTIYIALGLCKFTSQTYIWRPQSLSELTPIIFKMELTHLGSDASNCEPTKHEILNHIYR